MEANFSSSRTCGFRVQGLGFRDVAVLPAGESADRRLQLRPRISSGRPRHSLPRRSCQGGFPETAHNQASMAWVALVGLLSHPSPSDGSGRRLGTKVYGMLGFPHWTTAVPCLGKRGRRVFGSRGTSAPDALKRPSRKIPKHGVWIRVFRLWGFRFIGFPRLLCGVSLQAALSRASGSGCEDVVHPRPRAASGLPNSTFCSSRA